MFTLKGIVKLFTVFILGVAALSYLSYATTWFNMGQYWSNLMTTVKANLPENPLAPKMESLEPISQPAYKWLERGRWVYGDAPPAGANAIRLDDPDAKSEDKE